MKTITQLNEKDQKSIEGFYNMAIRQLQEDGKYTVPTMILVDNDDKFNVVANIDGFRGNDYGASKDSFAFQCREIAKKVNARLSVFFSEIWTKTVSKDSPDANRRKSLEGDPDARDAMLMLIELPGRKHINCITPFTKDADGKVVLEEMQVQVVDDVHGRFTGILPNK